MSLSPRFQEKHNYRPHEEAVKEMQEAVSDYANAAMTLRARADLSAERQSYLLSKAKRDAEARVNAARKALDAAIAQDKESAQPRVPPVNEQNAATHTYWATKAETDLKGWRPDEAVAILERKLKSVPEVARPYYLEAAEVALKGADAPVSQRYAAVKATHMHDNDRAVRGLASAADHLHYRTGYLDWHLKTLMEQAENHRQPEFGDAPEFFDTSILPMWLKDSREGAATDAEGAVLATYEGADAAGGDDAA